MEPPADVAAEVPFRRARVAAAGVRLTVVDDGPRDARETLLFLHGNPAWSFLWRRLLARGMEAGHRVVAPDLAGFGLSDKPEDPAWHSLPRHVASVEAVVDALRLHSVTLVLHDWGGPIGMGLAARAPGLVRRIVVTNTTAFAPRSQRAYSAWHRAFGSPLGYRLGVATNLVQRSAMRYGVRRPLPDVARRAYAWPMRERGARVAAGRLVQMVPSGPEHPTARALAEYERAYPALASRPMLVLWADRDPVMPPRLADRWKKSFPRAEVVHASATAGHFWQEDDPEPFAERILDFVAA